MHTTATPALELSGLSKHFGGVRALDSVDFRVLPGEVHGLLGENGSGKSTLIKVLAGFHVPDAGELRIAGRPVRLPLQPGQFLDLGLSFVHQDLGLIPSLTVAENLRLADLGHAGRPWRVSWAAERRRAKAVFERYELSIRPSATVASLSPMERAMFAIVRAVEGMQGARPAEGAAHGVLILDEPTVFLARTGIDQLFALVREVAARGSSIVFVSHDLDEVREITDRITVLRDGKAVGTVVTAETSKARLVELIIGRKLAELAAERRDVGGRPVAAAASGVRGGRVVDFSCELHEGEVLGVTGLAGSGFEDVPYLLCGARRTEGGTLAVGPREVALPTMTPAAALRAGIVLLPADRQRDGAVGSLSITDNVTLPVLDRYVEAGTLRRRRMSLDAHRLSTDFDIRPNDPSLLYAALSGGNQQKAMLAKWLQAKPQVILMHEPTQGVDVGARQQIFAMIRAATESGASVVCASSDYEQLVAVCDRVVIMALGRTVRELVGTELTKERIAEQCYQSVELAQTALAAGVLQ